MSLQLEILNNTSKFSTSAQAVAKGLSTRLGYNVNVSFPKSSLPKNKMPLIYGHQIDKLTQYEAYANIGVPSLEYTKDKNIALDWLNNGHVVIARKVLSGSEGNGIVVIKSPSEMIDAPVYTKYAKRKQEFRVHVFCNNVVRILEKRKKKGVFEGNTFVRNTANGYVFCREDVNPWNVEELKELALKARRITRSDFVGVDVGFNDYYKRYFVIETNSAPGIEGSNVNDYVDVISNLIGVN